MDEGNTMTLHQAEAYALSDKDWAVSESNDWNVPGGGAEIYETVFGPAMMGAWAPRVMALGDPQPGDSVLDVACGTGLLTRIVAKAVGPQGRVVGYDISTEMLAVARKLTPDPSHEALIDWREGDAVSLPFASETFDIVFCEFGLMFFPDRAGALNEMRRVLKPGGRLALSVWGSIDKCPGQLAVRACWERHFGAAAAGGFYAQHSLGDPELVLPLLRSAGFKKAFARRAMGAVRLSTPEQLVRSYGALGGTPPDESTRALMIREVSEALQPHVGPGGLVYPIEAILAHAKR
jgi:SAM-dependent methyltransferase